MKSDLGEEYRNVIKDYTDALIDIWSVVLCTSWDQADPWILQKVYWIRIADYSFKYFSGRK